MNAIFGLKVQVSIGDKLIIGIATGTGAYLSALPPPNIPKLACGKVADEKKMAEVQKQIQDAMTKNKEYFNIKIPSADNPETISSGKNEEGNSSGDEDLPDIDLSAGNKDACILEVDDADDVDIIAQLIDPKVPPGFDLCNTETLPGLDNFVCNLQPCKLTTPRPERTSSADDSAPTHITPARGQARTGRALEEDPSSLGVRRGFFKAVARPHLSRTKRTVPQEAVRHAEQRYPNPRWVGFRLRGVQPFSGMVASRHRRHHRAQYQMSQPTVPLVLGKFSRSQDPSS
ncbi:c2 domain-containing protein 5 [Trichonephila clavipes]|nr:c2 domain-containing protein 5 [Trichonephila clavipes]